MSGGRRVALSHQSDDLGARLVRVEVLVGFDRGRLVGQRGVFDAEAKPSGVVALPQVMPPGLGVDAFGQLRKNAEILRLEIELRLAPAKVKAAVFAQIALGVFTQVAAAGRRAAGTASLLNTTWYSRPKSRMASSTAVSWGRQVARTERPTERRSTPRRRKASIRLCGGGAANDRSLRSLGR